jgi:3-hydroxymyristoyl/3-hydroxydecanoyl-(acyl carrier protein) dehydratase/malonyl CoA-acyl carrier protein transacylase
MRLRIFSGTDRAEVLAALEARRESDTGPARLVLLDPADAERAANWLRNGGPQPRGVAFREAPISGGVAFVYTNGAAAYDGMGRELAAALPDLAGTPLGEGGESGVLGSLLECARLGSVHTAIARTLFGLRPDAAIGYSFGETVALIALGVWRDPERLMAELSAGSLCTTDLVGELRPLRAAWRAAGIEGDRWASFLVRADRSRLEAAVAAEPGVHLLLVSAPGLFVIGGEAAATARVGGLFGEDALPIDHELAAHVPELVGVAGRVREVFTRPVRPAPGIRFYSGATARSYEVTAERVGEAMTDLLLNPVDFPALIERAYADGARVFVEMGPRRQCTGFIDRILDGRDHVAVAMDEPERGVHGLWRAVAELAAAGVEVDAAAVARALSPAVPSPPSRPVSPSRQVMVPPPALPPVLPQPGPVFDRSGLNELAQGRVSAAFGPELSHLDHLYNRVRLPRGPMLLLDRVTGVFGAPMSRGRGTIHAETDVRADSWFLDSGGRMPAGLMAETMQGVLALISWLGLDPATGDQSARLLDQEVVFHGPRPSVGEILRHVARVDEHFEHDGMILVSVSGESYVGDELRMSVRKGRIGVYARNRDTMGVRLIWEPKPGNDPGVTRSFDEADIAAFDLPMLRGGPLSMIREIPEFDPRRGYLRAVIPLSPDDWYFDAHFPNDPVMPGNVMCQLGLHAASFYLAALGHTAGREDWEFDTVPEHPMKIRFRDQATPDNRLFECELFVDEVTDDPYPTLRGDVLMSVDGVKSGLCEGAAVRLVPTPAFHSVEAR